MEMFIKRFIVFSISPHGGLGGWYDLVRDTTDGRTPRSFDTFKEAALAICNFPENRNIQIVDLVKGNVINGSPSFINQCWADVYERSPVAK